MNEEQFEEDEVVGELFQPMTNVEELFNARKITFQDIKSHMTGPVLSICLHIILITLLMTLIVGGPQEQSREILVDLMELKITEVEKIPESPIEDEIIPDEEYAVESPTDTTSSAPSESTNVGTTEEMSVGFSDASDARVSNIMSIAPSDSPLVLPGIMSGRTKGGIKASLKKYGAPAGTDAAIIRALRWLKEHQNEDGSWGENANFKPAFTGLAVLTFLGHGETPSSAEFGSCVLKGIKKLVEYSNDPNPVAICAGNGYGHQIVTYALSEAYGMTRIPLLESSVNKMIDITVKGQNAIGGYDYGYNNEKGRCDMSVMGWAYQALKAAFACGSTTPNIEASIEKAIECLKIQQKGGNGFVYETFIGSPAGKTGAGGPQTSAIGTLCLQLFGEGKSPEALEGVKYLKDKFFDCSWDKEKLEKSGGAAWALYRYYYQTQSFFQNYSGVGNDWKAWNKLFTAAMLKNQKADGHWESPASELEPVKGVIGDGGGEAMFKGVDQGIYSTTLCCLTMEVFIRYLPSYKIAESRPQIKVVEQPEDGLEIK